MGLDQAFPELPSPPALRSSQGRDLALWLLRRRRRFRVTGNSMQPLLQPGQEVLIDPAAYRHRPPQPGEIVVACHPQDAALRLIKQVVLTAEGGCFLRGLNDRESTDSRHFGLVPLDRVLGRVVCRFP